MSNALVRQLSTAEANVIVGVRDPDKVASLSDETSRDVYEVEANNPKTTAQYSKAAADKNHGIGAVGRDHLCHPRNLH